MRPSTQRIPGRLAGALACAALLALAVRWYVAGPVSAEPVDGAALAEERTRALAVSAVGKAPVGGQGSLAAAPVAGAVGGNESVTAQELQAGLLVAQVSHGLGSALRRAASQGDFGLAPARILESLLKKRCGLLERHADAVALHGERLGLEGKTGAELCRSLLLQRMKEQFALGEDVPPERLWELLGQVDAEYARLVVKELESHPGGSAEAARERFRAARRELLGPELTRRLFGLSDDLLRLPERVDALLADASLPRERKVEAWQGLLQQVEREHGVRLSTVVEPVDLARLELKLREAEGPLDAARRQEVLERYMGSESARRHLEHQQQQQALEARLEAFNRERQQRLVEMAAAGLTPEEQRARMPELDRQLFEKYHLQ